MFAYLSKENLKNLIGGLIIIGLVGLLIAIPTPVQAGTAAPLHVPEQPPAIFTPEPWPERCFWIVVTAIISSLIVVLIHRWLTRQTDQPPDSKPLPPRKARYFRSVRMKR